MVIGTLWVILYRARLIRGKFPDRYFAGKPLRQNSAQGTGISLMLGSDMQIISAIFQGEVITAGFGKLIANRRMD
jgi:hypothetical protein